MPSKDAIREVQHQVRAGLSAMVRGASSFTTPVGCAMINNTDLFCVELDGQDILWIPEQAKEMQTRLVVCDHMKDAEHRGVVAALQLLQGYCSWFRLKVRVTEFVKQCLHCMTQKRVRKPRDDWERRCTEGDLARFYILTTCTSKTAVPRARID